MSFSKWISESKKSQVTPIHADVDNWLKSVDGLSKDLAILKTAKEKVQEKIKQIKNKYSSNAVEKEKEKEKDEEIKEKEKTAKTLNKDVSQEKGIKINGEKDLRVPKKPEEPEETDK